MTRIDEIIANALAGIPETDVAILAREVVRLREAPTVVVPEWVAITFASACVKAGAYAEGDLRDAIKNAETGYNFAASRVRAIPADRVLGEGERKICSEEWMYLRSLERYARKHGPESIQDVIVCLDALRANQGGADHE